MDGFKNTTKMKYMCGGPVRKATGGMMKSVAPKSVSKSAASAKQLPTPEIASKPRVQPLPPKDVVREAPRPTMEPKRLIAQTPPKDVKTPKAPEYLDRYAKTIGRAPEDVKTIGGAPKAPKAASLPQWKQSDEDAVTRYAKATSVEDGKKFRVALGQAKQAKTGTPTMASKVSPVRKAMGGVMKSAAPKDVMKPNVQPTPPKDVRTMGGAPKDAKTFGNAVQKAQAMGAASRDAKTMGSVSPAAKTMGSVSPAAKTMGSVSPGAKTMGSVSPAAKTMGSVSPGAKRGVPVASNKPMIGQFKTGGHVTKSSFKW